MIYTQSKNLNGEETTVISYLIEIQAGPTLKLSSFFNFFDEFTSNSEELESFQKTKSSGGAKHDNKATKKTTGCSQLNGFATRTTKQKTENYLLTFKKRRITIAFSAEVPILIKNLKFLLQCINDF